MLTRRVTASFIRVFCFATLTQQDICMSKRRLSVSIDAELVEAAERAVARGRTESLSAFVNDALRLKLDQERQSEALAACVAAYEADYGEITPEEMNQAAHRVRSRASVVVVCL
jgi:Arc/MetJ-type ribon-helix-helix transcriptional regulator